MPSSKRLVGRNDLVARMAWLAHQAYVRRQRLTVEDIQRACGVCRRTAYRYLDAFESVRGRTPAEVR